MEVILLLLECYVQIQTSSRLWKLNRRLHLCCLPLGRLGGAIRRRRRHREVAAAAPRRRQALGQRERRPDEPPEDACAAAGGGGAGGAPGRRREAGEEGEGVQDAAGRESVGDEPARLCDLKSDRLSLTISLE